MVDVFCEYKDSEKTQNSKYLFKMKNKKICNICGLEKDFSDFHKWKYGPDGFKRECKKCRKIETTKYYLQNSESIKDKASTYRKEHPEKVKEVKKKIYERKKESILNQQSNYKKQNRKNITQKNLERRKTDPIHHLKHIMNSRIRMFLKSKKLTKTNKTFTIVGCTPYELKEHLERKFTEGMSWNNQGYWHIDHIIPLSSAKNKEEIYKLCHYTNLQPLWAEDNLKKGSKIKSLNL
jgi:hypothetical protein